MNDASKGPGFSYRLNLRHRFTISRSSSVYRDNVFFPVEVCGRVAWGEAAPNVRYGETVEVCLDALDEWATVHFPLASTAYEPFLQSLRRGGDGKWSALAALDMAVFDGVGKALGVPVYGLWGLDPRTMPPTSMTIGMTDSASVPDRVREAGGFEVLKIKLGSPHDREIISAIRRVTDQRIRVDVNEGWSDREHAIREIEWLATQNVELVEQPMPAREVEAMAWLKPRSPLPLIADESVRTPADVLPAAEVFHGINIKLAKCGGILPAREMIVLARHAGLAVMLGCMVESSLGIAAAAHLAPLVDYADLDGNLLIAHDPFEGHGLVDGRIVLNDAPGLGVTPKAPEHFGK